VTAAAMIGTLGHPCGGGKTMETFTVDATRPWLTRAFTRHPLVRFCDRWEARLLLVVLLALLVVASVAGAVGTAVYENRGRVYAEQRHDRQLLSAVMAADSSTTIERGRLVETTQIQWIHGGVQHLDAIEVVEEAAIGDAIDIWVDKDGNRVAAPRSSWRAAVDATLIDITSWLSMSAACLVMWKALQSNLARRRARAWDGELRSLVDDRSGRTGSQG
jgi:hypothetical protein